MLLPVYLLIKTIIEVVNYLFSRKRINDFLFDCKIFFNDKVIDSLIGNNILNYDEATQTYSRKPEEEAFKYLDWFMTNCYINNLYCILDLHCAPVTQNGYEHSGHIETDKNKLLWYNENAINATCDLWAYIADHYKTSEIGKAIATYDILNEPCTQNGDVLNPGDDRNTKEDCYPVFNKIYSMN